MLYLDLLTSDNGFDVIQKLINKQFPVDYLDEKGYSMLTTCVEFNFLEIATYLIENGADINQKLPSGTPLIHYAVVLYDEDFINFLIKKGADLNAIDENKDTALDFMLRANKIRKYRFIKRIGGKSNHSVWWSFFQWLKYYLYVKTGIRKPEVADM